jgi:ABC-2 type transport system permease protein
MKGLAPLLRKEIKEQLRTYRLLIVGGVLALFGITTPLMLKYLPEILKLSGEEMVIEVPPPTAIQALTEYATTIGQFGVLVAVLVAMGCIANELRYGTALMTLSKPVSRTAFVSAKLIALTLTFLVSLVIASAFCFAYTYWLIEPADIMAFAGVNLLLALFLIFCLAITLLFSSVFRSSLAAGGVALGVLIIQAALSSVPRLGDYIPGKLLGWANNILSGSGDEYWWALAITVVIIFVCIYLAQRLLKYKDI